MRLTLAEQRLMLCGFDKNNKCQIIFVIITAIALDVGVSFILSKYVDFQLSCADTCVFI